MNTADIERCLFDRDGSCRDINFANPSWVGVDRLILWINREYNIWEATDSSGADVAEALSSGSAVEDVVPRPEGYVQVLAEAANALIRNLQLFVGRDQDAMPFVEITFFPDDLTERTFTVDGFVQLVQELHVLLEAGDYFVRYEDASWKIGECGHGSGVIFSSTGG